MNSGQTVCKILRIIGSGVVFMIFFILGLFSGDSPDAGLQIIDAASKTDEYTYHNCPKHGGEKCHDQASIGYHVCSKDFTAFR
jgi:hypothetical protein